mmetsp:Transcript_44328/g.102360  ORF Transcript_44328/g.102360 Transcript_44328/m.102360 type:complete len:87 (+) Transcript_44328:61-321(+)
MTRLAKLIGTGERRLSPRDQATEAGLFSGSRQPHVGARGPFMRGAASASTTLQGMRQQPTSGEQLNGENQGVMLARPSSAADSVDS